MNNGFIQRVFYPIVSSKTHVSTPGITPVEKDLQTPDFAEIVVPPLPAPINSDIGLRNQLLLEFGERCRISRA